MAKTVDVSRFAGDGWSHGRRVHWHDILKCDLWCVSILLILDFGIRGLNWRRAGRGKKPRIHQHLAYLGAGKEKTFELPSR